MNQGNRGQKETISNNCNFKKDFSRYSKDIFSLDMQDGKTDDVEESFWITVPGSLAEPVCAQ